MYKQFIEFLSSAKKIAIITHRNPDGDAFGSALAVREFLNTYFKDKEVSVFTDFATLSEEFKEIVKDIEINPKDRDFDSAICLDAGDKSLFCAYESLFDSIENTICIDHHKSNFAYAKINIVSHVSSNCELLYTVFKGLDYEITKEMGKYLCVGILTDTNALSTNNVTADTYKIVSELDELGVDVYGIRKMFFSGHSIKKYKIIARAMNKVEILCDNKVLLVNLTKQDFEEFGLDENDTVGIINSVNNIKGACACFLITPRKEKNHVSMRSVDGIDVSKIAESLGGGGHACAAACDTELSVDNIKTRILDELSSQMKNFKLNQYNF